MGRYSSLQALPYSFFARGAYRDAARRGRGVGLLYVLFLAAIMTALVVLRIELAVLSFNLHQAPRLIAQLPTITIDHGRLSTDANPVAIRDPDSGRVLALIDTAATVTALEGSTAYVLFTRDYIAYRKSAAETRIFDLSRVEHFVWDRNVATRWTRLVSWLAVVVLPFILVGLYLARLVQQLVASFATLLVARVSGVALDLAGAMRLAALAITPATLVLDLIGALGGRVPGSGWIWCAITLGYVMFGVNACRPDPVAPTADDGPTAA
jgi:uncharacterized protein DUF1189